MFKLTSAEISEYMAFDQLKNDDYRNKLETDMMTPEEVDAAIDKILGV